MRTPDTKTISIIVLWLIAAILVFPVRHSIVMSNSLGDSGQNPVVELYDSSVFTKDNTGNRVDALPVSSHPDSTCININSADRETLTALKGIGPVLADRIVTYREAHGMFTTKQDIQRVKGIGEKTLANIAPHICL